MRTIAARVLLFLLVSCLLVLLGVSCSGNNQLILVTTSSTQDSGLLDVLVPMFEDQYGYDVKTNAVGSGQALKLGEQGEADVILSHSPKAEEDFMAAGNGESRQAVMHNDFIIVGPPDDPAVIRGSPDAVTAFSRIANAGAPFISRGDQSGTNVKELAIWDKVGIQPSGQGWYQETGQGQGATLSVANDKRAYTLSDRATYLAQKANYTLDILSQGDPALYNSYHVIVVNPDKHSQVNAKAARDFAAFITSAATQNIIRDFGRDKFGQSLFVPDAYVQGATASATASPMPAR
ncbi:MAG: tungsten ABC transporter substrate-binding protein [Chloroflexi bacterium]|nr:MAG: tungsten ABC transporter substrate-binding protein [Chloroflexota bacterium]